jgi:hypothetical protein
MKAIYASIEIERFGETVISDPEPFTAHRFCKFPHHVRFHIRSHLAKKSRSSKQQDRPKGVFEPRTRCLACADANKA